MSALLRAELLKLRTTRTFVALVTLAKAVAYASRAWCSPSWSSSSSSRWPP